MRPTKTAIIQGFVQGIAPANLVIPDTVTNNGETYQVAEIAANAFIGSKTLTSVVLGANVRQIDNGAFGYCNNLTTFDFSHNHLLTSIGDNAFADNQLASITLPDSVTTIGYQAFAISNQLTTMVLPAGLTSLGASAFIYSGKLATVTIPAGLPVISTQAFASCSALTTLNFPSNSQLTTISKAAFIYDASLQDFALPTSLRLIDDEAFLGDAALTKVAFGPNLQSIGNQAFTYDSSLKQADFSQATSLQTVGDNSFEYDALSGQLNLPTSLKTVGTAAFLGNHLSGLNLNQGLTTIGQGAFAYNTIAGTLSVPATVSLIDNEAFKGNQIDQVDILGPTVDLGTNAFTYNRITRFNANQLSNNGSIGVQNEATIFTDPAHVSLSDLFNLSADQHQNLENNLQISQISDQVTEQDNKFIVPQGTNAFSFDWDGKYQGSDLYSGHYDVVLNNPDIKVINSRIHAGSDWSAADNLHSAQLADGTPLTLAQLQVTITDPSGAQVDQINTSQPGTYQVTYAYGNDTSTASVDVYKMDGTYQITGSQSKVYNGSAQTPDSTAYKLNLPAGLSCQLQPGDLTLLPNQPATNAGTYAVTLSEQGIKNLATSSSTAELYNWTMAKDSAATFEISQAAASYYLTGQQVATYNGQVQQPTASHYQLKLSTGQTITDLTTADLLVSTNQTIQNAGTYPLTISGAALARYTTTGSNANYHWQVVTADQAATYTVTPAHVTITANNASRYTGQSDPAFTSVVIYQDPVATGTVLNYQLVRAPGEAAGTYPINVVPGSNPNYLITPVAGNLTIKQNQQLIAGNDFTMYLGDPQPTVTDFQAVATNIDGLSEAVKADLSQVNFNLPGDYPVILTTATGQIKQVTLHLLANLQSISGQDVTIYQGSPQPTLADFKATATDKTGAQIAVTQADFSQVNDNQPGRYEVILTAADGQHLTKTLTILPNLQSLSGHDVTIYQGDATPTLTDFGATATDQAGEAEPVQLDLSQVDFTELGNYAVRLTTAAGQQKTVKLVILKNQQSLTSHDVTMYQSQTAPILADFAATATDKTGAQIAVTQADFSKVKYNQVGTYPVVLTAADGQKATAKLTILANQQAITGKDLAIYLGDDQALVAKDFQASATAKDGTPTPVSADLANVDAQQDGSYPVILYTADGQTKTVQLHVLANQQRISAVNFAMHIGQARPTVTDFQAQATDKDGHPLTVTQNTSQVDFQRPGVYPVTFTTVDGQQTQATLTIAASLQVISGSDYTMYLGDPRPTATAFAAQALDVNGQKMVVTPDFSQVNFTQAGSYPVTLKSADGQSKIVTLHLLTNAKGISGQAATIYAGDPLPTVTDFQAVAKNEAGNSLAVTANFSQVKAQIPGSYPVVLTASDGQTLTVQLNVLTNQTSIQGSDYTMYLGDPLPTALDFQAHATDKSGQTLTIAPDFSQVNFKVAGVYPVRLTTSAGQELTVHLRLLVNQEKMTASNYQMTLGAPRPTVADFQAVATDKMGQPAVITQLDDRRVDFTKVGQYPVTLTASDGQMRTVILTIIPRTLPANKPSQPQIKPVPATKPTASNGLSQTQSKAKSSSSVVANKAKVTRAATKSKQSVLPQTGDQTNHKLTIGGWILALVLNSVTWLGFRDKKHDQD
jgi:hypothetical protein